ncbi:unnamed protein product [Cylicocyclus nassatus]|uniref:Uncharacterized protein n=1 Tax=Cylicocyclus nassatus TaxID=53992 RepID=A0AA36GNT6_CYLNA|nr:unnamed protein product [Cylicocyclus nassatus]
MATSSLAEWRKGAHIIQNTTENCSVEIGFTGGIQYTDYDVETMQLAAPWYLYYIASEVSIPETAGRLLAQMHPGNVSIGCMVGRRPPSAFYYGICFYRGHCNDWTDERKLPESSANLTLFPPTKTWGPRDKFLGSSLVMGAKLRTSS